MLPQSYENDEIKRRERMTGDYTGTEGFENVLGNPKASAQSLSPREDNPYAVLGAAKVSISKQGKNKPMSKIQMRMRAISGDSQDDSNLKINSKNLQEKAEENPFSMITAEKDINF